eukprot:Opistho-2@30495
MPLAEMATVKKEVVMSSNMKLKNRLDELAKHTHFSRLDLDGLHARFKHFTPPPHAEKIDRAKFRDVLHDLFDIDDSLLMDRVFRTFDRDNDNMISFDEWIAGLSVILKGTLDEKLKFCFNVYDLNGDGYISKEEMFQMLQKCLIKQSSDEDPDEGIKDLVDLILKKMDHDRDGRVSFADYRETVQAEPLLLEAFGTCLPAQKRRNAFLASCTDAPKTSHHIKQSSSASSAAATAKK